MRLMNTIDQMNRLPDIVMPASVFTILRLSSQVEKEDIVPDEVIKGDKLDARFYLFEGTRGGVLSTVVASALSEARSADPVEGWRVDELVYYQQVLEGVGHATEAVRAEQGVRTLMRTFREDLHAH